MKWFSKNTEYCLIAVSNVENNEAFFQKRKT